MKRLIIFLIIGILIGIAAVEFLQFDWSKIADKIGQLPETATGMPMAAKPMESYRSPLDYEEAVIKAVEKASPAVVSIIVSKDLPIIEQCPYNPFGDLPPEFQRFFGPFEFYKPCPKGTQRKEVGGGSGFIVTSEGLIVTNKHVVGDEEALYTVLTNDGNKYDAKVLAKDPVQDLAIVKIAKSVSNLPIVKLGDSDAVKLGQTVIAIGNALGEFRNTVSVGIISGLARSITAAGGGQREFLEGLIQTDAAINPGNSGGPLLNLRGEVIGISSAMAAGAENIGFAIPINSAKRDIESVKQTGKISIPYIGIRYIMITPEIAKRDQLSVEKGALIRGNDEGPGVLPNSPAAKAGLKSEDIILEADGQKIDSDHSLASTIQKRKVGDTLRLKILREGKELELSVALEERRF